MHTEAKPEKQFRNIVNFRDLGGYRSADGRRVKAGVFYRSGGLYLMNEDELNAFRSLGIRYVMDLRTRGETKLHPDPVLPELTYLQYSGLEFANGKEIDFSPQGMLKLGAEGEEQLQFLRSYYQKIPFDNEAFRILFDEIAKDHVPLVFHCATGKDRTGVFAMLLLLALGVPRETVLADYLLSRESFAEVLEAELAAKKESIEAHPERKELITMYLSVSEIVGRLILDEIFTRYETPEEMLLAEYGADCAALRERYLV